MRAFIGSAVASVALLAATINSGIAADMAVRSRPPGPAMYAPAPVATWQGFYVGANVGYGWGKFNGTSTIAGNLLRLDGAYPGSATVNGVNGGGQLGYNWQFNQWVVGVEGDFQGSGEKKDTSVACLGCTYLVTDKITSFATLRARLGMVPWASGLVYVTGGWAWMSAKHTENLTVAGFTANVLDFSTSKSGWTLGAGYEQMIWDHWSAKFEYLYMRADGVSSTNAITPLLGGGTVTGSGRLTNNVVRLGANYHF